MMLRKARIVAVHPSSGTCDLAFLDNGQLVTNVEVMGDASSTFGCSWSTPSVPKPTSNGAATQISDAVQNMVAWCGTTYGNRPIIVGFSRPRTGVAVSEQDRLLDVHDASGGYITFAPDGTYEVFIPGGGYLRIGAGPHAAVPLAAGQLKANGPGAITVTLATAAGTLSLSPAGAWSLTGASLAVECDTTITGKLTVTEDVSIGGSLTVTGDATIGGKPYLPHIHTESGGSGDGGPMA